jgi:hypothetical protein
MVKDSEWLEKQRQPETKLVGETCAAVARQAVSEAVARRLGEQKSETEGGRVPDSIEVNGLFKWFQMDGWMEGSK